MNITALLAQADPRALQALERIATAQIVMAAVLGLVGLIVLVGALLVLLQVRAARREVAGALNDLRPRIGPLIDRARDVTHDVAGMTDNVRRKVDDILHTVEELHRSVRRGSAATEERLRRFTAVLDVVQAETEELLLDAAATARGVHETARVLREPRSDRGRQSPPPDGIEPQEEEEDG
jgi:methyl-accepting chemotaxis protein